MFDVAKHIWQFGGTSTSTVVAIKFTTTVGSISNAGWLRVYTVSGSMDVTIDFGDETAPITVACTTTSTGNGQSHTYGVGYESGVEKTITITIPDKTNVRRFSISGATSSGGSVPVNISTLENLEELLIGTNNYTSIPASILDLENLTELSFINAFNAGNPLFDAYPINLIYKADGVTPKPIDYLNYTILNFGDGSTVEFDRVVDLAPTLKTLFLGNLDGLPANFADLINLENLTVSTDLAQLPSIINSVTSLKVLELGSGSNVTNFDNLPALTNLIELDLFNQQGILRTDLPTTNFVNYTKLKTLNLFDDYNGTRADTFMDDMYSLVTANSTIGGTSANPFYGMSIDFRSNGVLTGTYQAPSGFSLGVSNGTPASQQEKLYVLVNNYGHTWTT